MSVFTTLHLEDISDWFLGYELGPAVSIKGIAAGITNTNYFVNTSDKCFVLTIFEKNDFDELPYFVNLMSHLAQHGIQCPAPIKDKNGVALHTLKGKPALMVSCLQGQDVQKPNLTQVVAVANTLARMHVAGLSFHEQSLNQRGQGWRKLTTQQVMPKLNAEQQAILQQEITYQQSLDLTNLPHGVIHGDLFRDNVLFDGDMLGGFIDFYYACYDVLAYDVAITVNEWCTQESGEFDDERLAAFMAAYESVRPFQDNEIAMWIPLLRRAALRFWLSRLYDFYFPLDGELTHAKDPAYFENLLRKRMMLA